MRKDFVVGVVRDFVGMTNGDRLDAEVRGDICDAALLTRAIAEYEIDTVFALAAQTQVSTAVADPIGTFEANVQGTWQVLEACRRQKVHRVIIASSDKAYGDGPSPYVEGQPLEASGIYATSKAAADLIAQSYIRDYKMSVAITRCGNLYGPGHLNWSTLIPGTIRSVLHGVSPHLRSNGGPKRDYTFVEDAVSGYLTLAGIDVTGAFNFGTGTATSVLEVVGEILGIMGSKLRPLINEQLVATEIADQVINAKKARDVLGWVPKHSLREGLVKTIDWYREHLKESS